MIVITGARGFIGSNLVKKLNDEGFTNLILVDELENKAKETNLSGAKYNLLLHRNLFIDWFTNNAFKVSFVFHLGARTDTTEIQKEIFDTLNFNYSVELFKLCSINDIPFVYASSAATYGNGENGYNDELPISNLEPLNEYGWSKQNFDLWVEKQKAKPLFWAGLKFFNVYGPNENHKGRMASVIYHSFHQIKNTGGMKLFKSHHPDFKDGEQKRDFIFINDLIDICLFFYHNQKLSGLYNVGTGNARTFNDLAKSVFKTLNMKENITYTPTPSDIRDKYQYFTEATTKKLRLAGFKKPFHTLEDGVKLYVKHLNC